MKKLIPLMILATVVSCGKKTKMIETEQMIYEQIVSSEKVGQVINSKHLDEEYKLNADGDKFEKASSEFTSVNVILKKEGDLVYRLILTPVVTESVSEEGVRNVSTSQKAEVELEDLGERAANISEMIKNGDAEIKGNRLIIRNKERDVVFKEVGNDVSSMKISGKKKVTIKRNVLASCESDIEIKKTNIVGTINGKESKLDNIKESITQTCGEILSAAELKDLDLTSVSYCDLRKSSGDCEDDKDMSFLTSDL